MFLYEIVPPIPNILLTILGVFNFLAFIFISSLFLIAFIGDTLDAILALLFADKYIVKLLNNIDTKIAPIETLNIKNPSITNAEPNNTFVTFINMYDAKIPHTIPIGIPIQPKINASYNTFFLICLLVAPTLASIPYCLIFSVIEILKLFFMQKTDVNIIIAVTIIANIYIAFIVPSLAFIVSNAIKY